MSRKAMLAVAISLLVAASLVLVGAGGYRAGQRHAETVEVVATVVGGETGTRTVIVPAGGYGWHGGWPGGPGFLLFPLILFGLFFLFASRRGGWYRHGRYGDDELREWHRRAHADEGPAPSSPSSTA